MSEESGVPQPTLSKWLREAGNVVSMVALKKRWTAAEKLRVVLKSSELAESDLGEFLRAEGLHKATLDEWRRGIEAVLSDSGRRRGSPEGRRIKALERELRRKDKALAEVAALLVLKKKASDIWGDEDDSTPPKSG